MATELDNLLASYREGELEAIVEMATTLKENATDVNDALSEVENYLQMLKNLAVEVGIVDQLRIAFFWCV